MSASRLNPLIDEAWALAADGIPTFPCRADKKPACEHGHLDATTDFKKLATLFGANAAYIGYPCGEASQIDVLDVDVRHGGDSWPRLAGLDKITRTCRTKSGGTHYLFRHAPGVKNTQSKLARGVDTRGQGGYAIAYPTNDLPIADWPSDILTQLLAPKPRAPRVTRIKRTVSSPTTDGAKQALADAVKTIEAAVEGERHETIRDLCMAIAALVLGEFLDEDEAHDAIIAAAEVCGAEDMDNVENLWSSAMEKATPAEPNTGDELGPLPPLDEDDFDPDWWLAELIRGKPKENKQTGELMPGPILANLHNATLYFRFHADWRGRLKLNEFSHQVEIDGRQMVDVDSYNAACIAQRYGIGIADRVALTAMITAAHRNPYHPVRDMLRSFKWDGVARLDDWLIRYAGAADTPLNRAFGAKTLIATAARVMVPGCKVDTVLILEGAQGLQKSSLFGVIAFRDAWFLDDLGAPDSKDTFDKLKGKWIVELAELDHMNRSDVATMKAFISRRIDTYRVAFGRLTQDFPRQCVIVGTVNPGATGYLKDETGARRFWPVAIGVGKADGWKIDLDGLKRDREQLFAEAVARYDAGEKWWLDTAALEAMQREAAEERSEDDPWHPVIADFVADKHVTTVRDILTRALKIDDKDQQKRHLIAAGAILKRMGWVKRSVRSGDGTSTRFVSPEYVATGGKCNVVPLRPAPTLAELGA